MDDNKAFNLLLLFLLISFTGEVFGGIFPVIPTALAGGMVALGLGCFIITMFFLVIGQLLS